jgi:hypothetical protein
MRVAALAGSKCHQPSRSGEKSFQDEKANSTQKKSRTGCPMRPFFYWKGTLISWCAFQPPWSDPVRRR